MDTTPRHTQQNHQHATTTRQLIAVNPGDEAGLYLGPFRRYDRVEHSVPWFTAWPNPMIPETPFEFRAEFQNRSLRLNVVRVGP